MTDSTKKHMLYDNLWKAAIEDFLIPFFYYFFPKLAPHINFEKVKILDKERPNLFAEMSGDGRADLIIEAPLHDGRNLCFILHIEIQGYYEPNFGERMFRYYYRLRDYYHENIISLAIFTDDNPKFHPKKYVYRSPFDKTTIIHVFNTFKIINKSDKQLYI